MDIKEKEINTRLHTDNNLYSNRIHSSNFQIRANGSLKWNIK